MEAWTTRLLAACIALVLVAWRPALAAEPELTEHGTFLIEVETGRTVRVGQRALVAWSPDGEVAAVAEMGASAGDARLRLVRVADGTAQSIVLGERGDINLMRWAPDGNLLAFTLSRPGRDAGPSLSVVTAASGVVRQIVRGSVGQIAWTPDSTGITGILLEDAGGSIVTYEAATGEVRESVTDARDASCQRDLAWSPDGAYLAYGGPGLREGCGDVGNWGLWVWEPAARASRQLFRGAADGPHWLASGEVVAMVSEPRAEGIPPLSLMRFSPAGGEPHPIARDIPRMFPQPPSLVQTVEDTAMYPVSTCDEGSVHVWAPPEATARRATGEDTYAYRPALRPDAEWIAYARLGEPNALVVLSLESGVERAIATTAAGLQVGTAGPWGAGGDWSPDGRWIAIEVTAEQDIDCVK